MESIGIDLHKVNSQICIVGEDSAVMRECRIRTEAGRFAEVFGKRSRARVVIEASTESEWVARLLEGMGHEVIVADPNFAPMYASRTRRVKTDRRDARALAEACRLGAYRHAHRTSDEQRHVRAQLCVREALVGTRTKYISVIRAFLRREGLRVRSGETESFVDRVRELELGEKLLGEIAPLMSLMEELTEQIAKLDEQLAVLAQADATTRRLCTVPGVGPVTSVTFRAAVDRVERFSGAHHLESYLGLVPGERSSGEKQHRGHITKSGNRRARWLLVEVAWSIMRSKNPHTRPLADWATRIALRRGKRIAAVALARRLAGILYAMWRDDTVFEPRKIRTPKVALKAA